MLGFRGRLLSRVVGVLGVDCGVGVLGVGCGVVVLGF